MIWLTIILMTAVVFVSRYLFLEPRLPLRLGPRTTRFLSYSAPAILTAITAPIVFMPDGDLALEFSNPYLISAALAVALAYLTRHVLFTTVVSMGVFFVMHV
ncbi:AzlD domain-containing protein [Pontibacterium granulatum]|uniref:AzlD domain-containing protein n=1 Tax=Pontibacterium granulatum TaxID=2036029 RepID=UPI00249BD80A|nr:AzlD domain-containing protein [Pontibacterium granulatum]MDI3325915.1 AzlD domain-containing protein [Pontibacterium granulatum]